MFLIYIVLYSIIWLDKRRIHHLHSHISQIHDDTTVKSWWVLEKQTNDLHSCYNKIIHVFFFNLLFRNKKKEEETNYE